MGTFTSAFVTGASSGIGRAIAHELAARGARVILAARREPELRDAADAIRHAGGNADVCVLDVADTSAACDAVVRWDRDTGGLDLIVASAGIDTPTRPADLEWATVERVLRVNALGTLATIVAAVKPMIERRRGTLSAISSLAAMRGLPGHAPYSASKAAVSMYLEALRAEVLPYGVRVVDVRPGFVDTPLSRKNRFTMPFLMDVDDAARVTVDALERGTPVVTYPWQLSVAMRFAHAMPDALWRRIAPRLPR